MKIATRWLPTLLAPLVLIVSSCATTGINLGQLNLISTEDEIQLGNNLEAEVDKEEPILRNPTLTRYVDDIGQKIASYSDRPDIPYRFKIIDNDKEINAFALPGGPIYVYTGLLKLAENEAELASVLGHEIAHIAARHSTEQLTKAYGFAIVAQLMLGEEPGEVAAIASDVIGTLGMRKFSRNDEIEADRLGLRYMFRAGYSPNAMIAFEKKLGELGSAGSSRVMNLLSTHPITQDRIEAIRQEIAALPQGRPVAYHAERYKRIIEDELR